MNYIIPIDLVGITKVEHFITYQTIIIFFWNNEIFLVSTAEN